MTEEKVYTEAKLPEVAPEALALLVDDKSPDEVIIELQKKLEEVTKAGQDIEEIERISFLVTELVKLLDVEPPYVEGIDIEGMKGIEVEAEFQKYLEQYTEKLHKAMPDKIDMWSKKITSYGWKQYMKDVIEPQQNYANQLTANETASSSVEKVEETAETSVEKVEPSAELQGQTSWDLVQQMMNE